MFTQRTFKIIDLSMKFASYFTGTPYHWNFRSSRLEIRTGLWPTIDKYLSLCLSLLTGVTVIISYTIHLRTNGLNLNEIKGVWRFGVLNIGLLTNLFVICAHRILHDLTCALNTVIIICQDYEESTHLDLSSNQAATQVINELTIRIKKRRSDNIFSYVLHTLVVLAFIPALNYLGDCKMHFLDVLLPNQICEIQHLFEINDYLVMGFVLVKYIGLLIMQLVICANYNGGIIVFIAYVYPTLFSMLEILQDLSTRKLDTTANKLQDVIKIYRKLQILQSIINSSILATYVIPGHIFLFSILFSISVNVIVLQAVPIDMILMSFTTIIALILHYSVSVKLLWRITKSSEIFLQQLRFNSDNNNGSMLKIDKKKLISCRPIKFQVGLIGHFDKVVYLFVAGFIVEETVNTLILSRG